MARLPLGDAEVVVFSFPSDASSLLDVLTPSERDVARLVMAGHSNAAVARERRTTPRTVSKQLDAIYRKVGVHSRAELVVRFGESMPMDLERVDGHDG